MNDINNREIQLLTICNIMRTENGRSFMYRCLHQSGVYGIVFDKDSHQHAFNSGAREHGLWLEAELKEAAPDEYLQMLKENIKNV